MVGYNVLFEDEEELGVALSAVKDSISVKKTEVDKQGRISVGRELAGKEITAIVHEKEEEE